MSVLSTASSSIPSKYLQPSPVRGQLEPYNERSAKGWRYLQCTDTPNEFKVLLPPRTANLYDQLLKVEIAELAKPPPLAWDRILEIRHIKDRMIRKSQRLSKVIRRPKGDSYTFHTALAPLDFRLKEMEKWLKVNHFLVPIERTKKGPPTDISLPNARNSYCCKRCAAGASHLPPKPYDPEPPVETPVKSPPPARPREAKPTRRVSTRDMAKVADNHRLSIASNLTRRSSTGTLQYDVYAVSNPQITKVPSRDNLKLNRGYSDPQTRRLSRGFDAPPHPPAAQAKITSTSKAQTKVLVETTVLTQSPTRITSPEPLPHLLRRPSMTLIPEESQEEKAPSPPPTATFETPKEAPKEAPKLTRRRSCIKRSNSTADPKTVSWAPDNEISESMGKYIQAADELKRSGLEYDEIRTSYLAHMASLDTLHKSVSESLQRIRTEAELLEGLQTEIASQRDNLRTACDRLESQHGSLQERVQAILSETQRAVSLSHSPSEVSL